MFSWVNSGISPIADRCALLHTTTSRLNRLAAAVTTPDDSIAVRLILLRSLLCVGLLSCRATLLLAQDASETPRPFDDVVQDIETEQPISQAERIRRRVQRTLDRQRTSVSRQSLAALPDDGRKGVEAAAAAPVSSLQRQLDSIRRQAESVQLQKPEPFTRFLLTPPPMPIYPPIAPTCQQSSPEELESTIQFAATREGLTPDLLRGVIRRESAFWPCAVSHKGAMGLMQLMPQTAAELGVRNPFDPKESIAGGARYLGGLLRRFDGDVPNALAAYNAGPERVDQYNGPPPFPETKHYIQAILGDLGLMPAKAVQPDASVPAGVEPLVPLSF